MLWSTTLPAQTSFQVPLAGSTGSFVVHFAARIAAESVTLNLPALSAQAVFSSCVHRLANRLHLPLLIPARLTAIHEVRPHHFHLPVAALRALPAELESLRLGSGGI